MVEPLRRGGVHRDVVGVVRCAAASAGENHERLGFGATVAMGSACRVATIAARPSWTSQCTMRSTVSVKRHRSPPRPRHAAACQRRSAARPGGRSCARRPVPSNCCPASARRMSCSCSQQSRMRMARKSAIVPGPVGVSIGCEERCCVGAGERAVSRRRYRQNGIARPDRRSSTSFSLNSPIGLRTWSELPARGGASSGS